MKVVDRHKAETPLNYTHSKAEQTIKGSAQLQMVDIEDSGDTSHSVTRARLAVFNRIRVAAGREGAASSATVGEFHRYLIKLREEEDGPFQCLVAALLRQTSSPLAVHHAFAKN